MALTEPAKQWVIAGQQLVVGHTLTDLFFVVIIHLRLFYPNNDNSNKTDSIWFDLIDNRIDWTLLCLSVTDSPLPARRLLSVTAVTITHHLDHVMGGGGQSANGKRTEPLSGGWRVGGPHWGGPRKTGWMVTGLEAMVTLVRCKQILFLLLIMYS